MPMSSRAQVLCGFHVVKSLPITVSWRRSRNDGIAIKWMANDIITIKWIANDNNAIKVIAKMADSDSDSDSEYDSDSDSKKETSPLYYHIGREAKKKFFFETLPPSFQKRFFIFSVEFVAK